MRLQIDIERTSTGERVAAELRRAIFEGEIHPGTALRDHALAEAAGVSRATVREALRILEHEGLASRTLHRGVIVRMPSRDEVREVYILRRVIEVQAARSADSAALVRLAEVIRGLTDEMRDAAARADRTAVVAGEVAIHSAIVAVHNSRRLSGFFREALNDVRLALTYADPGTQDLMVPVEEHETLVRAFAAGDAGIAASALTSHLDAGERRVLHAMRSETSSERPRTAPE